MSHGMKKNINSERFSDISQQISLNDCRWILTARFIASFVMLFAFSTVKFLDLLDFNIVLFAIAPMFEMFINQPYRFLVTRFKNRQILLGINHVLDIFAITWGMHFVGGTNMPVLLLAYTLVIIYSGFALRVSFSYILANLAFVAYATTVYLEHAKILPTITTFKGSLNLNPDIKLTLTVLVLPLFNLVAHFSTYLSVGLKAGKNDLKEAVSILQLENRERKEVEQALRLSEEKYRTIFELFVDLYYQTDMNGVITNVSPSCARLSGYLPEEVIGKNVKMFYPHPQQRKILMRELLYRGTIDDFEIILRGKDGRHIPSSVSSRVIYGDNNEPIRIEGTVRDISIRKRTEEKLRQLSSQNEAILAAIPDIIMEVNLDRVYTWANKAGIEFFGEDVIGKSADHYFEGKQDTFSRVKPLFKGNEEVVYVESWQRRKDNKPRLLAWWCRVLKNDEGKPSGALSTARDITEIRQAEQSLLYSERKYRSLIEAMRDGVGYTDLKENILFANSAMCRIFGYSRDEIIGMNLNDIVVTEDMAKIYAGTRRRRSKRYDEYEITIRRKDGQLRQISASVTPLLDDAGNVIGSVGILADVSDIKKAEEEKKQLKEKLIRAQRMESLGVLAGGVAHDLNNILGPLVAYPDIIKMDLPEDSKIAQQVTKMERSAQRAVDIVQDLLTMARRGRYEMSPLSINDIIEDYLSSADFGNAKLRYPNVELQMLLDRSIPAVHGSYAHLSKVIMNLIINAMEAMPEGGLITIKTEHKYIETLISGFDNIEMGEYAILTVSDTGLGIDEKDLKHLFEPFYTKKEMGRSGSGLGLAIVYGVLKDHNGYIDVISKVNEGSNFLIYLPIISIENTIDDKPIIDIRGSETILVVDDIEEQRELASTMLSTLGYKVEVMPEGRSAIKYIKTNDVDLVVLDMIMENDFDGLDTYKEIVKFKPGQKAIIASGYSQTDRVKTAESLGVAKYIRKPYTMQKLGKAIREVLEANKVTV